MLGLGWLIYFSFGMVMSSLVPIVTLLREELGISYTQMGFILGAWQLVYIAAAAPSGLLIDRIGPKKALVIGALIIALSGFLRSQAEGFWTLFGAVALFGLGGPIVSIGLPKLVVDWFSGSSRGLSLRHLHHRPRPRQRPRSCLNASRRPAAHRFVAHHGRALGAFRIAGGAPLDDARARQSPGRLRRGVAASRGGYRAVITQPAVWSVIIVGFSAFLASHGLRGWLPQILEARGMSPANAGLLASLPALSGVLGSILILRLASRGAGNRRRATIALLLVTGLCVASMMFVDGWLLVLVIGLEGFCAMAIQPLMLNILMEMPGVGPRRMGTAAGIFFSVGEVGGTLGPVFLGLLADMTGSFTPGLLGMAAIMWIMLVPALRIRA